MMTIEINFVEKVIQAACPAVGRPISLFDLLVLQSFSYSGIALYLEQTNIKANMFFPETNIGLAFFSKQEGLVLKTLQYSNYNLWSMFCLFPVFCLLGRHLYSSTTSLRCGLGLVSKVCCTHQSPLTSTVKMEVMWAKTARSYAQATVFYTRKNVKKRDTHT